MANEIDRRYGSRGLHGYSVHPGGIQTNLSRHMTEGLTAEDAAAFRLTEEEIKGGLGKLYKSIPQGASSTVWAAVAKELEGKGGVYIADCEIAERADDKLSFMSPGYAAWTYDVEGAKRLWNISLKLVGLPDEQ